MPKLHRKVAPCILDEWKTIYGKQLIAPCIYGLKLFFNITLLQVFIFVCLFATESSISYYSISFVKFYSHEVD